VRTTIFSAGLFFLHRATGLDDFVQQTTIGFPVTSNQMDTWKYIFQIWDNLGARLLTLGRQLWKKLWRHFGRELLEHSHHPRDVAIARMDQ